MRIASFLGLPVGPIALSTAPVPLRKPHARHRATSVGLTANGGSFRLKLASSLRLHSLRYARSASACAPPTPDRSHKSQPFGQNIRCHVDPRQTCERAVSFAVTNARFCHVPRVAGSALSPLDRTRSTSQTVRSSRASIRNVPQQRRASVCGSAAGVALRLRFAMPSSPPSAPLAQSPRSPTRRPKPSVRDSRADEIRQSVIDTFRIVQSVIETWQAIRLGRSDTAMKSGSIVWRRRSRQGSAPSLPPPPP